MAEKSESQWRIELLGRLCACRGERRIVRFRTRRAAAILAYLAFYSTRSHPRDELIELFWPDEDMDPARNGLRVALSSLRGELRSDSSDALLLADRSQVQLAPQFVATDVAEFESLLRQAEHPSDEQSGLLHAAVELYRGELLPGFDDWWIAPERQRLADAYLGALRQLTRLAAKERNFDRALDFALRAVNVDPTREESHRTVMRLYATLGRPRAVQRQYEELERHLRDQLQVAPSGGTRRLLSELCAGDALVANQAVVVSRHAQEAADDPHQAPAPSSRLPIPVTSFFGREEEIASLSALLRHDAGSLAPARHARLVTLTGAGGTGKTRLALEVAERLMPGYQDNVWFVPLADLAAPARLTEAVAKSLSLDRSPEQSPLDQTIAFLSNREALLVLDNAEHLLQAPDGDETRAFVCALLERTRSVRCLVTSRQRLDVATEQEFPLLPLPTPGRDAPIEVAGKLPSIQLLIHRAQSIRPSFRLTEQNAEAVATLCRRLQGLPLAIELAAGWAQTLTPPQMLARLDGGLDFLVSSHLDGSPRHRAMRTSLEWSYRLLTPDLQAFFKRLSVFRGGWTLEALEQLQHAEGSIDVLGSLRRLLGRSLVVAEEIAGEMRYRLLEVVREFADELLSDQERCALRERHAATYTRLAEEADSQFTSPDQVTWLDRLEREIHNLRAALDYCTAPLDPDGSGAGCRSCELRGTGLRLAGALHQFWRVRGYLLEGREYLLRVLTPAEDAPPTLARAKALAGAWMLAWHQGDPETARQYMEEGLAITRALGEQKGTATLLNNLGNIALCQGRADDARACYEESIAIRRALDDELGAASPLGNLGELALQQGNDEVARGFFTDCLAIYRKHGYREGIAGMLHNLGQLSHKQGNRIEASELLTDGMSIRAELGDLWGVQQSLAEMAHLARTNGVPQRAARLWGIAAMIEERIGRAPTPDTRLLAEQESRLLRETMGQDGYEAEWSSGRALALEDGLRYACNDTLMVLE